MEEEVSNKILDAVRLVGEKASQLFLSGDLTGYLLPALIVTGIFFLFFGLKIYRPVVILVFLIAGFVLGYLVTERLLIALIVAVAAGILAYPSSYVFAVLMAAMTLAALIGTVFYFAVDLTAALIGGGVGFLLGTALFTKFFKPGLVFSTAALSAATMSLSITAIAGGQKMNEPIEAAQIEFNPLVLGILFASLLVIGVAVQTLLAMKKKPENEKSNKAA